LIEIDCSCGETYWADDSHAGRSLQCRKCGKVLSIGLRSSLSRAGQDAATLNRPIDATITKQASVNRRQGLWAVLVTFGLIAVGVMLRSPSTRQPTEAPVSNTPEASPVPASPAEAKEREIVQENAGKPGDPDLCKQYQDLNEKHFGTKLPTVPVLWEPRLAEIGPLKAKGFTQEGLWAAPGDKPFILLNPQVRGHTGETKRALCHEMIHEYLFTRGDTKTNHGPAFQAELRRLLSEGAFPAILASEDEKANLRAWLGREQDRLNTESLSLKEQQATLDDQGATLDRERTKLDGEREGIDRETQEMNQRIVRANDQGFGWPPENEIEALKGRALLHDQRVAAFNARLDELKATVAEINANAVRNHADVERFNIDASRYKLMMAYPDGLDEEAIAPQRKSLEPVPIIREIPERQFKPVGKIPLRPTEPQPVLTLPDANRP